MALLFMDGFDHYGNAIDLVASGKWGSSGGNSLYILTNFARTGGASSGAAAQNFVSVTKSFSASGGFVVGIGVRLNSSPQAVDFLRIREGSTDHLVVSMTVGGLLQVKVGASVLATGVTPIIPLNWYYIEFKGVIHDTTGSYELRIDNVPELVNAGPIDTRNAGATGQWDRVFLSTICTSYTNYDDFYVCDQSGPSPWNTFLGPIKIETLLPQTDAVAGGPGANVGLTPSTGTDHGAMVDEVPANTTDYNSSVTVGTKDTYNFPTPTLSGTILGVQTNLYLAKSDSFARQACAVVRVDGADYDGANVSPLTTFQYFSEVRAQKPTATTPVNWVSADLVSIQVGMKVTA